MTESQHERDGDPSPDEPAADDELLEPQEHKGYGEDEGEREDALPDE